MVDLCRNQGIILTTVVGPIRRLILFAKNWSRLPWKKLRRRSIERRMPFGTCFEASLSIPACSTIERCPQCGAPIPHSKQLLREIVLSVVCGSLLLLILIPAGSMTEHWMEDATHHFCGPNALARTTRQMGQLTEQNRLYQLIQAGALGWRC